MKSLRESLFDTNLVTKNTPTTLYELFGSHIKKVKDNTYGRQKGWTHFFNTSAINKEWKKEGSRGLSGGYVTSSFPIELRKFVTIILKNLIVAPSEIKELPYTGELNCYKLNDLFRDKEIILPEDAMWGATPACRIVRVYISYLYLTDRGNKMVGFKSIKGLDTENIEIQINFTRPNSHVPTFSYTLLTNLTIKDI